MNIYDSQKIVDYLRQHDKIMLTEDAEKADIFITNTCSVREKAQTKLENQLALWHQIKKRKDGVIIAVGGCVATQEGEALQRRFPYVDIVFGPQTLHRLPGLIQAVKEKGKNVMDISFPAIEKFDQLPKSNGHDLSAFVSIMEGCNKFCAFCVVPYTRGPEMSRPVDSILHEVKHLVQQGAREIVLLGQNVNDYQGEMRDHQTADLSDLIRMIAVFDQVLRIRFITSHPSSFSDRLISTFKDVPKLADHFHLPVQSGSNRTLALMKRGYSVEQYEQQWQKLKMVRPQICLSSDFIVGFPTETEEDFKETLALAERIPFDHSYSFLYSPRPGTPAADLQDGTPLMVKKRRLQLLQQTLKQSASAISQNMLFKTHRTLVTGRSPLGGYQGMTDNSRVVHFLRHGVNIGDMVSVHIREYTRCFIGEIVLP